MTIRSLQRLFRKFRCHHTIKDLPRRKRCKRLSEEMTALIDDMLKDDDETTARHIRNKLRENFGDFQVSLSTVKQARRLRG